MMYRSFAALMLLVVMGVLCSASAAYADAEHKTPAEIETMDADKEVVGGLFPGLIVTPHHPGAHSPDPDNPPPGRDPDRDLYRAACVVFIPLYGQGDKTITGYERRFVL